jgi:hypothetical protein
LAISAGSADAVAQRTFGQGCSGDGFAPAIELVGRPGIGGEFALALSNARPIRVDIGGFVHDLTSIRRPARQALLVLGFSEQSLSLDYLGGVGCELLVSPQILIPVAVSPSDTAELWFYIPPDPELIGLPVYAQWGVTDGSSLSSLSMTAGLAFEITPVTHPSACDGAVLLEASAGWECINGVWCFVDKAKWRCPDGLEYETRVEQCTTDPCTPDTPRD